MTPSKSSLQNTVCAFRKLKEIKIKTSVGINFLIEFQGFESSSLQKKSIPSYFSYLF
jgi:predicted xylose isomerase-like sugar epimerase